MLYEHVTILLSKRCSVGQRPFHQYTRLQNSGYQSTGIAGSQYCGLSIVLWLWGRWLAVRPFLRTSGEADACAGSLFQWCLLQDADVSFALSLALARCRVCLSCSACGSSACSAVRCLAFGLSTGPPVMRHLRLRRREEFLPPWVLALAPRLGTAAIAPGTLAQGVWALPH